VNTCSLYRNPMPACRHGSCERKMVTYYKVPNQGSLLRMVKKQTAYRFSELKCSQVLLLGRFSGFARLYFRYEQRVVGDTVMVERY
jgi:hypothetical protein